MPETDPVQNEIIDEFRLFDDWMDRYQYLIDLGRKLPDLPQEDMTDEHLLAGCQSQVWLHTRFEDGNVIFEADSDAAITKGLVALMVRFYSQQDPETIINTSPDFIKKIGMEQHLSPTRSNGLASMVKQMKIYAMAYKTKQQREEAEAE